MNTSSGALKVHHVNSNSQDILSSVRMAGVNMAVWTRRENPACVEAIDSLLNADEMPMLDLKPKDSLAIIEDVAGLAGKYGAASSMSALAEDIRMLSEVFCEISDTCHARIRLWRVEDDACRLFHADTLHMRMLCTYAGPGTEWLEHDNARYEELGSQGRSIEETNSAIVRDAEKIRRVSPWDVAIFTGRLRPDTPPLIHRSAPISSLNKRRIRLCIDLPDACGC